MKKTTQILGLLVGITLFAGCAGSMANGDVSESGQSEYTTKKANKVGSKVEKKVDHTIDKTIDKAFNKLWSRF
jgi:PBP1b-binding outer membrane lipoprotein LpoB